MDGLEKLNILNSKRDEADRTKQRSLELEKAAEYLSRYDSQDILFNMLTRSMNNCSKHELVAQVELRKVIKEHILELANIAELNLRNDQRTKEYSYSLQLAEIDLSINPIETNGEKP